MIRNLSNSQRKIKEQNTDPKYVTAITHRTRLILYSAPPHIFDGKAVARNVGNFQLCDISDLELRELLENPCWWTSECNVCLFSYSKTLSLKLDVGESRLLPT